MATLVAAGLLAIVVKETQPWKVLGHPETPKEAETQQPPEPQQEPPTQPQPLPAQPEATATAPPPASTESAAKPSPMTGAAVAPPKEEPAPVPKKETPAEPAVRRVAPARPAPPQPVMVISSPGGAIATLDRQRDTACTTPCSMDAAPGRHKIEIVKPGYELERRDVDVGSIPVELPAVVLRPAQGTLMLTSQPEGAAVLINGKRFSQVTPAQINLAPGTYKVTVEWNDGKQVTRTVEIRNGINYQKFLAER
jgi:hypothetical protein